MSNAKDGNGPSLDELIAKASSASSASRTQGSRGSVPPQKSLTPDEGLEELLTRASAGPAAKRQPTGSSRRSDAETGDLSSLVQMAAVAKTPGPSGRQPHKSEAPSRRSPRPAAEDTSDLAKLASEAAASAPTVSIDAVAADTGQAESAQTARMGAVPGSLLVALAVAGLLALLTLAWLGRERDDPDSVLEGLKSDVDDYVSRHGVLPPTLVGLNRFPADGTVEWPTDKWRVRNNEGRAEIIWYSVKSTGYYAIVLRKGNEQWVIAKDKAAQRMSATP